MMRHSHDHAVLIRKFCVQKSRTVILKPRTPRRPEIISFQAKKQFKDRLVCLRIRSPEMVLTPGTESRPLIINKESPVFHRWFLCNTCHIRAQPDFIPMHRHHMTPVHKRGYTKDLRQMKQSVYRSPLIASDNDKQSLPQAIIREKPSVALPFSF